ncbi:MAG: hypothetical protein PHF44_02290 [Candidatus Pacebacteria bacterium]|nr:hypothetical protein [Candidatus Paceibacterota bacterium]
MTIKIYLSWQKSKSKTVGYLLKVFLSFTTALLVFAPNGIIIKDPRIINLIFNIYTFFFFLGLGYFVMLTFEINHRQLLKRIIFPIIIIYGLLLSIIPSINLKPALVGVQKPFIFWEDTRGPLINTFIGAGLGILSFWVIFFFFNNGIKVKEKYVRQRSFLISGGVLCFLLSSITDFVFGANPNIFYISIYTMFFNALAIGLLLFAVEYKKEEKISDKYFGNV